MAKRKLPRGSSDHFAPAPLLPIRLGEGFHRIDDGTDSGAVISVPKDCAATVDIGALMRQRFAGQTDGLSDGHLDILRILAGREGRPIMLADLAAEATIGERTLYRLLPALKKRGLIAKVGGRQGIIITSAGRSILAD
jgi:hypothetical protein